MIDKLIQFRRNHPKKAYFICFTCFFILAMFIFFSPFLLAGKSFIWSGETKDGLVQHYNSLMYYGTYLRNVLQNIFTNLDFSLPMWDFSLGYGADVVSTLHYYVIGDPLNLLSVFVAPRYTEYLYMFLIILRLYLAGLAFSYFCGYMKKGFKAILLSSFVYILCGYVIFASIRHPYFINPMIYLPLLFVGVEKILNNKSPVHFILLVSLSAISNFYFFYMLVIFVAIYTIIRFFRIYTKDILKKLIKYLLLFLWYGSVAILISGVILFPVIYLFFGTSRSEDKVMFDMLYSTSYYLKSFLNFNSYNFSGFWTINAFSAISVLSIIALFINKGNVTLKSAFVLSTLSLSIPFIGYMLNGFSYVSNRWEFGYAFVVALIVCYSFESLINLCKKKIFFSIIMLFYVITSLCFQETNNINAYISCFFMIIIYIICVTSFFWKRNNTYITTCLLVLITILSSSTNAYFKYDSNQRNYTKEFVSFKKGYKTITNTRAKEIANIEDDNFFRYDETRFGKTYLTNAALKHKQHSLSFFYSLGSGDTTNFFNEMNVVNALSSLYTGVNYRTHLEILASVKYFIAENNQVDYIPYGYDQLDTTEKYAIFKNRNSLPLGYTYDSMITRSDYDKLTPLKKQQALLQSVVLEKDLMRKNSIQFDDETLNFQIVDADGVDFTDNGFSVNKKGASITLSFDAKENTELYLSFDNLEFKSFKQENGENKLETKINVKSNNIFETILCKTPYNTYYNGTNDYLLNLGYDDNKRSTMTVSFDSIGEYKCDNIKVLALGMSNVDTQVQSLNEDVLQNIDITSNVINGEINLNNDKFLCLSIPYSEGWTIYVDGKERDLYKANTMYMGIPLEKGHHKIELYYKTPLITVGLISTSIGFMLLIGIVVYNKKNTIL